MNDDEEFQRFMREQARALICGRLGHSLRFVLPLQIKEEGMAFCGCVTCGERLWFQFPPEGFKRLLNHAAAGKIQ